MSIQSRIIDLINRTNLSQAELARQSGVSKGHISAILKGKKRNPGMETVRRIAYALGVTVADIVNDDRSLVEFSRSAGLAFEEYNYLLDTTPENYRPTTVSGWHERYQRMQVDSYPGLATFMQKANLTWSEVQPLVEGTVDTNLPQTSEGWEEFFKWHIAFGR